MSQIVSKYLLSYEKTQKSPKFFRCLKTCLSTKLSLEQLSTVAFLHVELRYVVQYSGGSLSISTQRAPTVVTGILNIVARNLSLSHRKHPEQIGVTVGALDL